MICTANLLSLWCIGHKICASTLWILWDIEASALMPQDLYCRSVDTLVYWSTCCFYVTRYWFFNPVDSQVYWSICSSYVTRFILQICSYSGILKHLFFLCHKSRWEITQKLTQLSPRSHPRHLLGKKDSTIRCQIKPVDTLVYWSICCSSNATRFVLQICWDSGALKHLLFLCHKICTFKIVDTLVHWSTCCSSNDIRFVLQSCWYSGTLKHLLLF